MHLIKMPLIGRELHKRLGFFAKKVMDLWIDREGQPGESLEKIFQKPGFHGDAKGNQFPFLAGKGGMIGKAFWPYAHTKISLSVPA